ncbi:acetate--CoA ligase family protein [Streptacidiphilus sp. PAMC 29251]
MDLAQQATVSYLPTQDGSRFPSYADPQTAARALAHARDRARWLAEPPSAVSDPAGVDSRTAETLVQAFLTESPEGGTLDPAATARLFHCYGLPVSASPATPATVTGRGAELFAGVVQDEVFGPLVLFGTGGTSSRALDDRAARLAPLTRADIRALLTSPRSSPLLPGRPGSPAADLDALEDLLGRLSRMACDLPQLAEAALNLLSTGTGAGSSSSCVDARIRLEPRGTPDPYLRRLRRIPGADRQ